MRPRRLDFRPDNRKARNFYIGETNNNNTSNESSGKQQKKVQQVINGQYPAVLPPNMELFSNQVAGHMQDGVNLGLRFYFFCENMCNGRDLASNSMTNGNNPVPE
ncbi:hypothetical protein Trydic_g9475 [Trypoxylus dichotomus]